MSGFSERGDVVNRRSFAGARARASVDFGYTEREGSYYLVAVAREVYEPYYFESKHGQYRLRREGVYLPIHFKHKYRAEGFAKLLNGFFRTYRGADVRKDDD